MKSYFFVKTINFGSKNVVRFDIETKGLISCTLVQCATYVDRLARVVIFVFLIGIKNTKYLEDIKYLLHVKFQQILLSIFEISNIKIFYLKVSNPITG